MMGSEDVVLGVNGKAQNVQNGTGNAHTDKTSENGQAIPNGIIVNELIVGRGNGNGNGHKTENGLANEYADGYSVRALEISDHRKGFVELIGQLSPTPPLSEEEFQTRFAELASLGPDHHVCVIEDPSSRRIVATGSVFIERKFIRGCSKAAHIEDVVVDKEARGLRLGQRVIKHLVDHAKATGCYKVVLYCKPELKEFYQKCGFVEKDVQMAIYF